MAKLTLILPFLLFQVINYMWKIQNPCQKFKNGSSNRYILRRPRARVDMVGTNRDKVLTLWRHMLMGKFCANIFLIRLTSTYFWASEVFKNQSFKSRLISPSLKRNTSNWNNGLILMLLLVFINDIQNLYQYYQNFIIH